MTEEEEVRITLRMPVAVRDALTIASGKSRRSMNNEIVARLEESFGMLGSTADKAEARRRVENAMRALQSALIDLDIADMLG